MPGGTHLENEIVIDDRFEPKFPCVRVYAGGGGTHLENEIVIDDR